MSQEKTRKIFLLFLIYFSTIAAFNAAYEDKLLYRIETGEESSDILLRNHQLFARKILQAKGVERDDITDLQEGEDVESNEMETELMLPDEADVEIDAVQNDKGERQKKEEGSVPQVDGEAELLSEDAELLSEEEQVKEVDKQPKKSEKKSLANVEQPSVDFITDGSANLMDDVNESLESKAMERIEQQLAPKEEQAANVAQEDEIAVSKEVVDEQQARKHAEKLQKKKSKKKELNEEKKVRHSDAVTKTVVTSEENLLDRESGDELKLNHKVTVKELRGKAGKKGSIDQEGFELVAEDEGEEEGLTSGTVNTGTQVKQDKESLESESPGQKILKAPKKMVKKVQTADLQVVQEELLSDQDAQTEIGRDEFQTRQQTKEGKKLKNSRMIQKNGKQKATKVHSKEVSEQKRDRYANVVKIKDKINEMEKDEKIDVAEGKDDNPSDGVITRGKGGKRTVAKEVYGDMDVEQIMQSKFQAESENGAAPKRGGRVDSSGKATVRVDSLKTSNGRSKKVKPTNNHKVKMNKPLPFEEETGDDLSSAGDDAEYLQKVDTNNPKGLPTKKLEKQRTKNDGSEDDASVESDDVELSPSSADTKSNTKKLEKWQGLKKDIEEDLMDISVGAESTESKKEIMKKPVKDVAKKTLLNPDLEIKEVTDRESTGDTSEQGEHNEYAEGIAREEKDGKEAMKVSEERLQADSDDKENKEAMEASEERLQSDSYDKESKELQGLDSTLSGQASHVDNERQDGQGIDATISSTLGQANDDDDDDGDEYGDIIKGLNDLPSKFQDTAQKVATHLGPNIQKITDTSKSYFNKANQQITESFSPLVGKQFAPLLASLVSYGLLLLPLAVVVVLFEHIRTFLSLQRVMLFLNIYLAAYFATLTIATFVVGEPMNFFFRSSPSGYIHLQLIQALGYIIYLILQTFDLVSSCASQVLPIKFTTTLQWFVALGIGLHYYVTVFHRAMGMKGPLTSWKIYGIYSIAFCILCLFARLKRSKKDYNQLGNADTNKKN